MRAPWPLRIGVCVAVVVAATPAAAQELGRPRAGARAEPAGPFSIELGAVVQARAALELDGEQVDDAGFHLRRGLVGAEGHVGHRRVRYELTLRLHEDYTFEVRTATVSWRASRALRLQLGRDKVPGLREWGESSQTLPLVERSLVSEALRPGRSLGALGRGAVLGGRLTWEAGVFARDTDDGPQFDGAPPVAAVRLVYNPLGREIEGGVDLEDSPTALAIGTSLWRTQRARDGNGPGDGEWTTGLDVAWRRRGLDLTAEYAARREPAGPWRHAGYGQAAYHLRALHLTTAGRVSAIDDALLKSRRWLELAAGITYHIDGHRLQVQGGYAATMRADRAAPEHALVLQLQAQL